jgi:hypothetical protein
MKAAICIISNYEFQMIGMIRNVIGAVAVIKAVCPLKFVAAA